MQVVDVKKVLGSVGRMTDANNTIIFSKGKSIITSDPYGAVARAGISAANPNCTTELEKRNGVYTFDMWIPAANENSDDKVAENNNYHEIGAVSDFAWLEDKVM